MSFPKDPAAISAPPRGGAGRAGRARVSLLLGILLVLSALVIDGADAKTTCYGLTGQVNALATACNANATGSTGSHSACCNEGSNDACLSSGLCLNTMATVPGQLLWATGCTDPTFNDPSCPQICKGPKFGKSGTYFLRSCDTDMVSNSWCCGEENQTLQQCCQNKFTLDAGVRRVERQLGVHPTAILVTKRSVDNSSTPGSPAAPQGGAAGYDAGLVAGLTVVSGMCGLLSVSVVVSILYIRFLKRQLLVLHQGAPFSPGPGSYGSPHRIVQPLPSLAPESALTAPSSAWGPSASTTLRTIPDQRRLYHHHHHPYRSKALFNHNHQRQRQQRQPPPSTRLPYRSPVTPSGPSADDFLTAAARKRASGESAYSVDAKLELLGEEVREMFADENAPWRAVEMPDASERLAGVQERPHECGSVLGRADKKDGAN